MNLYIYIYIYTHTILIIHSKAKDSLFLVSTESRTPFILSPCTHKENKKSSARNNDISSFIRVITWRGMFIVKMFLRS